MGFALLKLMESRKFVNKLKEWIESIEGIQQYTDNYNNWCYGTSKQKHIIHLHPYNTHADIEINNSEMFRKFLNKFDSRPHEWNTQNWLIINIISKENYDAAKEVIIEVVKFISS